ncbi:MAG: phosphodiester glycosidase family protein [Clostridia bacterium]|nr:phosphodiester glycosidase family protein [Clostridia bacterium]
MLFILCMLLFAAPALGEGPPNPLCFTGQIDYTYSDGRLWINIQRKTVLEPKLITYFVCDIQTTDPGALKSAVSYDEEKHARKATSVIAERENAVLAINGDGYGFRGTGIVMRNGQIRRTNSVVGFHLLTLDNEGDLSIETQFDKRVDPLTLTASLMEAGVRDIWSFGPALVYNNEATSFKGFTAISTRGSVRAPRTAIGQLAPLHYVILVVDGRRPEYSNGMSLPELQALFLDMGVETAFNLDGGGSTTLYFLGEIINRPSDHRERTVSDILYLN